MSHKFAHSEYLLPAACLVACLQALACLSEMDKAVAITPTGQAFHVIILVAACLAFSGFAWGTLREPRGFKIALVSYMCGVLVLATGIHAPQTQAMYRIACNAFGEAQACASAAESATELGWYEDAAKYATRTCAREAGWKSQLDCASAAETYRLDGAQQCRVAQAACAFGIATVCEHRPVGCEVEHDARSLAEACDTGYSGACLELARAQSDPNRAADYGVMACERSGGQLGCHEAILSGLAAQRMEACSVVRAGGHYRTASNRALLPQCMAILETPF